MPSVVFDPVALLSVLNAYKVDFILVGGTAAVIQGAPIQTFDLDIVHRRTIQNSIRLSAALAELNATYRDPAGRIMMPKQEVFLTEGHQLLITSKGPLDVLGMIGDHQGFEELVAETLTLQLESGASVLILKLEKLIEIKEYLAQPKDLAVLPVLKKTLAELKKKKQG